MTGALDLPLQRKVSPVNPPGPLSPAAQGKARCKGSEEQGSEATAGQRSIAPALQADRGPLRRCWACPFWEVCQQFCSKYFE